MIYREEVTAVIGALADMVVYLRNISDAVVGEDGEEEEDEG